MHLRSSFYRPPGDRWFFREPSTKRYVESMVSLVDCERKVVALLETAGLSVPANLASLIEEQMCRSLPKGSCAGDDDLSDKRPGFFAVVEAVNKRLRNVKVVDVREAERRALICRMCPKNDIGACVNCSGIRDIVRGYLKQAKTTQDALLGTCRAHVLPAFALVWLKDIAPVVGQPETCWVKHE